MSRQQQKNYWFKRKRYGYGWVPATWQGWLATLAPGVFLGGASYVLFKDFENDAPGSRIFLFFALTGLTIIFAVAIARTKGPAPKWRGGKKPDDNPNEDW